jgi:hypothetical protein|tara:strand:- start:361 stop:1062 length:702 start_codon:yes stop_codon:yes gene_type:complete
MIVFKKIGIQTLGIIFIVSILFRIIDDTLPTLYNSSKIFISLISAKEHKVVTMTTRVSVTDYEAEGGDGRNFVDWCVNEMRGEVVRTPDNAYCVIEDPIPNHLLRNEEDLLYLQEFNIWFKNNKKLSLFITIIGVAIYFIIQSKLIYHLVLLFSKFNSTSTMDSFFENLKNLQSIVLCFFIMPVVSFITWEEFYVDSFIYALLAVLLYQFLHYVAIKYQNERKEMETENSSFI